MPGSVPAVVAGDNITINTVAVTDANLSDTTPVAAAGTDLILWQRSGTGPDQVSGQTPTTIPKRIQNSRADVAISNSAAETTILSALIAADSLGSARGAVCLARGNFLNNTGATATIQVQVKFGATTLWNVVSAAIASNANQRPFYLHLELSNESSTSAQAVGGFLCIGGTGGATTGEGPITSGSFFGTFNGTAAESTTVDKTLVVTVTLSSASANLTFTMMSANFTLF